MHVICVDLAKEVVEGEQGSRQEENCTCEPASDVNDAAAADDYDDFFLMMIMIRESICKEKSQNCGLFPYLP